MEFIVEAKSNSVTKQYIESLIPSLLSQLKLGRSRKLLHVILDKDLAEHGLTMDMTEATGSYLVVIRPDRNLTTVGMTLAHELVHVKQYARKELVDMCSGNYQMWNKVMYNENIVGYRNLPWEKEAIEREKVLYHLWREHQSKL